MSRVQRDRRTPLPPDQAVRPLVERRLAATRVTPRPRRRTGSRPASIPIVIDSDSESESEWTPDTVDEVERSRPRSNAPRRAGTPTAGPNTQIRPVLNDLPMGTVSDDDDDLTYESFEQPPQTVEALQALLEAAKEMGFRFKAPETEEMPLTNYLQVKAPETVQIPLINYGEPSRPPIPLLSRATPPPGSGWQEPPVEPTRKAVLLVNARLKHGSYKHGLLRTLVSSSALGAYESLLDSAEVAVANIVSALRTMDDDEIMLATSRKPIPMDDKRTYEDLMAGYMELGRLSDLDHSVQLMDAAVSEQRLEFARMYKVPEDSAIFILYIWSDENEDLPSILSPTAGRNLPSKAAGFVHPSYKGLFQRLVLQTPQAHSTFTGFTFVRIVLEVCRSLGINCAKRAGIKEMGGPHNLSIADVVSAFRREGAKPHLSATTFNNHRGWYFRAEQLFNTLGSVYPLISQMPDDLTEEKIMVQQSKDVLKTPLTEAHQLSPNAYGQMTVFVNRMKSLEKKYGLVKQDKAILSTGRASTSKRKEIEPEETDDLDEDDG